MSSGKTAAQRKARPAPGGTPARRDPGYSGKRDHRPPMRSKRMGGGKGGGLPPALGGSLAIRPRKLGPLGHPAGGPAVRPNTQGAETGA